MSNMLRKGKRIAARKEKKEVKKHTKGFYAILKELDRVADYVLSDEGQDIRKQLKEDNVIELLQPLTEHKLGRLEETVLLGKLGMYQVMDKQIQNESNSK